jgi:predicted acylesterase/phospholipase RssA
MLRQSIKPLTAACARIRPSTIVAAVGFTTAALVFGCAGPSRRDLTEAEFQERSAADAKQAMESFRAGIGNLLARAEREVEGASDASPATLDILALSGGGDFGAFGAGFLVGWGSAAEPEWRRPDFDVVTGVSTGALLAPFAYVGTDEACRTVESFYRNPHKNWVISRGVLFFLPTNPSFMVIQELEHSIRAAVDKPLVEQMAEQSRKGKFLAISATDLDLGRQKIWDVGVEAEAAVASGDLTRVQSMMLASSAIPAVFPPVDLDDSLYGDGGVTANVLVKLDPRSPDGFLRRWMAAHPGEPLPKIRYWIIINNQLAQPPKSVQRKWPSVLSPSLATAIRSATIAEVRWLSAQADYVNAVYHTDIEVRVTSIPNDWRPPVAGGFQKKTMESLADLGRKMGSDPNSWSIWARPGDTMVSPASGGGLGH